jgi:hypothetical protein
LQDLLDKFGGQYADNTTTVWIEARFTTYDAASNTTVHDYFVIEIIGSGEPLSAYCNYDVLTVAFGMEAFTYEIPSPSPYPGFRMEFPANIALGNLD